MKTKVILNLALAACLMLASCGKTYDAPKAQLNRADFQTEIDGKQNDLYILKNANGVEVTMINYGARIVSIATPDKNGKFADIVLGFDNIQSYLDNASDFGALIGRYGNRIDKGQFSIDGVDYQVSVNDGTNSLHGGVKGYQYCMFDIEQLSDQQLVVSYTSADGEMGFPGELKVKATYTLTDCNSLVIAYEATTDKPTVVNLTNHSYFNLCGDAQSVLDHKLYLNADAYTPVNDIFITTGEIASVEGTPMDFRKPTRIGERINNYDFDQLKKGNGYDHNWVLNTKCPKELAGKLADPVSGRTLEFYTNEPGVQVYTGNFLNGTLKGKKGITYQQRAAICLETQHYPDSPNRPEFPSVVLRPGETYKSICIYKFGLCQSACEKAAACEKKQDCTKKANCDKAAACEKKQDCTKKANCDKAAACEKKQDCTKKANCDKAAACEKKQDCTKKANCDKAAGCEKKQDCTKKANCEKAAACEKKQDCTKKANCGKTAACEKKQDCTKKANCDKAAACEKKQDCTKKANCDKAAACEKKQDCTKKANCDKAATCTKK